MTEQKTVTEIMIREEEERLSRMFMTRLNSLLTLAREVNDGEIVLGHDGAPEAVILTWPRYRELQS